MYVPTTQSNAPELQVLIWDVIEALTEHGVSCIIEFSEILRMQSGNLDNGKECTAVTETTQIKLNLRYLDLHNLGKIASTPHFFPADTVSITK